MTSSFNVDGENETQLATLEYSLMKLLLIRSVSLHAAVSRGSLVVVCFVHSLFDLEHLCSRCLELSDKVVEFLLCVLQFLLVFVFKLIL